MSMKLYNVIVSTATKWHLAFPEKGKKIQYDVIMILFDETLWIPY